MSPTEVGLQLGAEGPGVEGLQKYLRRYGYLSPGTDKDPYAVTRSSASMVEPRIGTFDEATAKALRAYQAFQGIPVTGELDGSSVAEMAMPRCGVPDLWDVSDLTIPAGTSRFVLEGSVWTISNLRYAFQNFSADLSNQEIRDGIEFAHGLWSRVVNLTFQEVALADSPEIQILFATGSHGDGSQWDFDGPGDDWAHGFYPPPSGGSLAGDLHFDDDEVWSMDLPVPPGGVDFPTVAAHEFGHALGLRHSTVPDALMRPRSRDGAAQRWLHQDDIDGITALYDNNVTVPFVTERRPDDAAGIVRGAGLVPKFTGVDSINSWVWRQSPRGGRTVDRGSTVRMQLRTGSIP
jgi:peptidoglycan hydrolase-like protein with peptidoglycan-binding domain